MPQVHRDGPWRLVPAEAHATARPPLLAQPGFNGHLAANPMR